MQCLQYGSTCIWWRYCIAQNFNGGNFDGYWLFKYLTENILTDDHCLSPYTYKHCIVFKQYDRLNFDSLAGKHQKRQKFPQSKFALYGVTIKTYYTHNIEDIFNAGELCQHSDTEIESLITTGQRHVK